MNEKSRNCSLCDKPISELRLEALPDTIVCIDCARKNPKPIDPRHFLDLSEASSSGRNGFAKKD